MTEQIRSASIRGTPLMFDHHLNAVDPTAAAVSRFAETRHDALLSASDLLGGAGARRRTGRLLRDLAAAPRLTRRLRGELVAQHRLLSLQEVADPDRDEAAHFALIDPASPVVEDLCLLTDELTALLERLAASDDEAAPLPLRQVA